MTIFKLNGALFFINFGPRYRTKAIYAIKISVMADGSLNNGQESIGYPGKKVL